MSVVKTYVVKAKELDTGRRDTAIVSSQDKQGAIRKFLIHMDNVYGGHFEYDENDKCYYNQNKTVRLKIKHINIHNDFILL